LIALYSFLAFAQPSPDIVGPAAVETPSGLEVHRCLEVTPPAPETSDQVGLAVFEIQIRRDRIALVSEVDSDPEADPLAPCFVREFAGWDLGGRRTALEVPIEGPQQREPILLEPYTPETATRP
jgi:hypothetical protein